LSILEKHAKNAKVAPMTNVTIAVESDTLTRFQQHVQALGLTVPESIVILIEEELKNATPAGVKRPKKSELYRNYWESFCTRFNRDRKPLAQSWFTFVSGVRGITYRLAFAKDQRLRIEVYLDDGNATDNLKRFQQLLSKKSEIETALGTELQFEPLDGRQACRIALYGQGSIDADWEPMLQWMGEWLRKFEDGFGPYLQAM